MSRAVISACRRNKNGWRSTSVEGRVTADVIFNTNSRGQLSEGVCGVRAPSALKSFSGSLGQTVRTVKDSSKVFAGQRRWVDRDVTSSTSIFDSSYVVSLADASSVLAVPVSGTEFVIIVARRSSDNALVKLSSRARLVSLASTVGQGEIGGKRDSSSWAPSTGKVQVVSDTFVTIGLIEFGKIGTNRRRWGEFANSNGRSTGTIGCTFSVGEGSISS